MKNFIPDNISQYDNVYDVLKEGTEAAREKAGQTLAEVKSAMRINYFDDPELIRSQAEKYASENK